MTPQNGPPPFPDGPVSDWTANTPRPTPPPPPRRTDRPRMIYEPKHAVQVHEALRKIAQAIHELKRAGLSDDKIELAFWAEMQDSWDN